MRQLHTFHGGIHPPTNKSQSTQLPIAIAAMPEKLVIPFRQHAGEAAKPVVQIGERVLKGQMIGEAVGSISSSVHAPTSGTITAIDAHTVIHPSGLTDLCATLIPDGQDEWVEHHAVDYRSLTQMQLRQHLRRHGIVGLGGATFPSDIKLRTIKNNPGNPAGTLIINGAECEPYITCDDMLMRERADAVVQGIDVLRIALEAGEVLIGIEDNKPQAIAAMRQAVVAKNFPFEVIAVPTIYPGGSAKHLIRVLTGLEVPSGKLPTDIGVQCFNVATAYSIYRAVEHGEPLLSRIVTVTGNVEHPRNFEVLIGTPVNALLAQAGDKADSRSYISGGPMMGIQLPSLDVPITKACNCLIAASPALLPPAPPTLPCIRCTRCAEACPAELQPQDLYWYSKSRNFSKAQGLSLFDCIECGACSYVCPSHIPLVSYYRFAKSEVRARDAEKQAADKARIRHEFRELRIEREKQEKAEKLAAKEKAALAAKQATPAAVTAAEPDNTAQMKIQAALEQAQKQAAGVTPKNTASLTPEQQAEIAEIEARRARIRELASSHVDHPKEN